MDAWRKISDEEGGTLRGMVGIGESSLLVPTILDAGLRSTILLGIPLVIERKFGVSPDGNAALFSIAEFVLSTVGLLVTIPIETVRRRLQVQSRSKVVRGPGGGAVGGKGSYKSCVETRPARYVGFVECTWRILTEETGRLYLHNAEQKPRRRPSTSRRGTSYAPPTPGGRRPSHNSTQSYTTTSTQPADDFSTDPPRADQTQIPPPPHAMPLFAGVTQLYRGFSIGVGANLIVLLLGLVAGREEGWGGVGGGGGWAEM